MKNLLVISAGLAAVGLAGFAIGKRYGKVSTVNYMRSEQLAQTREEYVERLSTEEDLESVVAWYAEECRVINEIFDEIINKRPKTCYK